MKVWHQAILTGCAALICGADSIGDEVVGSGGAAAAYSADAYALCAACHLPAGEGIPGAFPPLKQRTAAIAKLDGGREYLIAVVSSGLMGTIEAAGTPYSGIMPGNKGMMSAQAIADALNYVMFEFNDGEPVDVEPVTADEVEAAQAQAGNAQPTFAYELRRALVETYGDEWPQ